MEVVQFPRIHAGFFRTCVPRSKVLIFIGAHGEGWGRCLYESVRVGPKEA